MINWAALWTKFELYLIIAGVCLALVAAAYFKGREDMRDSFKLEQVKADTKEYQAQVDQMTHLLTLDNIARGKTLGFLDTLNKGIIGVQAKFGSLPSVVVDPSGCARFTPDFGLRWNQVETLPSATGAEPTSGPHSPVSSDPLPATH